MKRIELKHLRWFFGTILSLSLLPLWAEGTHEYLTTTKNGQLSELLEQCASGQIDSLTLGGPLGGVDLTILADAEGKLQNLVFLDLTDARPVGDGSCYRVVRGETINDYTDYYYYSDTLRTESHALNQWHRYYTNDLSALFYGNESLQEVRLPSTLHVVGGQTFYKCSNLKKVVWSENLSSIRNSAFSSCPSLRLSSEVLKVDTIGNYAFYACESLVDTLRLEGVQSIGDQAFWRCSSLECLVGDPNLQEIGASSFYACEKLDSVYLCGDMKKIGKNTFFGTPWFNGLPYENGVRYIQRFACELSSGAVAQNNGTVGLRTDTKGLGDELFYDSGLREIVLPSTVELIGERCFDGCRELSEIELPEGIKHIGRWAFRNASALKTISLPVSLESVGDEVFQGCTSLEHVDYHVPEASGRSLFQFCENIESVYLDNTVRFLPYALFSRCGNLKEVAGGENVEVISENAFYGCTQLKNFPFSQNLKVVGSMAFCASGLDQSLVLPESLDSIGIMAFDGCTLSEVVINHCIPHADPMAFGRCSARNGLVWNVSECEESCLEGNGFEKVIIGRDVVRLPQKFMSDAPVKIVKFEQPSRLREVGDRAFEKCRSLNEFVFPSTVERIGNYALAYCLSMMKIGFEGSDSGSLRSKGVSSESALRQVGDYAFYYNSSLWEIRFPEGVTDVGQRALAECISLCYLDLPSTLTTVGERAFYNCTSLKEVTCLASNPPYSNILLFENVPDTCVLYVPEGSMQEYALMTGWNRLKIKALPTGMESVLEDDPLQDQIKPVPGGIMIPASKNGKVSVYGVDGRCLHSGLKEGTLSLPSGIYIVRCGSQSLRIAVP